MSCFTIKKQNIRKKQQQKILNDIKKYLRDKK